jgi:hypothetical protein
MCAERYHSHVSLGIEGVRGGQIVAGLLAVNTRSSFAQQWGPWKSSTGISKKLTPRVAGNVPTLASVSLLGVVLLRHMLVPKYYASHTIEFREQRRSDEF